MPIKFPEGDDDLGCLCTFPHNDGEQLDRYRLRSLAYLGAAVVLHSRGELEHGYLPHALPAWLCAEIDRLTRPNTQSLELTEARKRIEELENELLELGEQE